MNKFRAFTFAELMLSLLIIAIITALLYPTIAELSPNNNRYLYKSAYKELENAVADIIAGNNTDANINTPVQNAVNAAEGNRIPGEMPVGAQLVCQYFATKLNTVTPDVGLGTCTAGNPMLQTSNGMRWFFTQVDTDTNIIIDVNSANNIVEGAGCASNKVSTYQAVAAFWPCGAMDPHQIPNNANINPDLQDTFLFTVSRKGKITVSDYGATNHLTERN